VFLSIAIFPSPEPSSLFKKSGVFCRSVVAALITSELATAAYLDNDKQYKIMFHIHGRNGVYIGDHSWIGSDEEVLFDRKIKFRALKSGETGYIKPTVDEKGIFHIAITEV
jgi:hypothetical protein